MDSKDRLAYSKIVIINHENHEYQFSTNVLQLEVVEEEEEEEEVGNRERTSTQRVMKIKIVNHHYHHYQKIQSITSNFHKIHKYSKRSKQTSRQ